MTGSFAFAKTRPAGQISLSGQLWVSQVSVADFPASWQEAQSKERSHDSRTYNTRFMLRLDDPPTEKLETCQRTSDASTAEIIRHLIAQAKPEDFPKSWQMRAAERHAQQPRP